MFLVTKLQVITKPRERIIGVIHLGRLGHSGPYAIYWTFNEHGMVPHLDPRNLDPHLYSTLHYKNNSPHVCHVPLTQFPSTLLSATLLL